MPTFPPGTVVLHVGPPKTGTTSLQNALDAAREPLREHGVGLPGGVSNPNVAVHGGTGLFEGPHYSEAWGGLAEAIGRSNDRLQVVSSEHFAHARAADARRIVETLGGRAVRVVITLRPLVEILPSLWQQFAQSGETAPFPVWLKEVLSAPPTDEHGDRYLTQIWQQQFVERWAAAAGTENVTVVAVDRHRPGGLLRDFETMIGVPEELLKIPEGRRNDSLKLAEVEFLQRCYTELGELGWNERRARRYLLFGAAQRMRATQAQRPARRDIVTPLWAQERAVQMGADLTAHLPSMGVAVVGASEKLTGTVVDRTVEPDLFGADAAVQAVVGVLQIAEEERGKATKLQRQERKRAEKAERQRNALAAVTDAEHTRTTDLLRVLSRRLVRKFRPRAR